MSKSSWAILMRLRFNGQTYQAYTQLTNSFGLVNTPSPSCHNVMKEKEDKMSQTNEIGALFLEDGLTVWEFAVRMQDGMVVPLAVRDARTLEKQDLDELPLQNQFVKALELGDWCATHEEVFTECKVVYENGDDDGTLKWDD